MNKNIFSGKSSRTKIFTVITVVLLILLLGLNLFVSSFGIFANAYIDLTPEGLYTLRPVMIDTCREIFLDENGNAREQEIKITFCNDRDKLIENTVTRVLYYLAIALSHEFENFKVEAVNVAMNPTAVAMYKTTSLTEITTTDVIISYGSRYRIASAQSFWRTSGEELSSFDGEYKLASIMLSLTLINQPVAYFVTDHEEDFYNPDDKEGTANMGYFADLLYERGLTIKNISLKETIERAEAAGEKPKIPEDCALLIVNNPKIDFRSYEDRFADFAYVSETELLDDFLTRGKGSIVVAKDYKITLPTFEAFLHEWGIDYSNTLVKDTENAIKDKGDEGTAIVGVYNTDDGSYAYNIYKDYADLGTAPRMVIPNTGYISCAFGDGYVAHESGSAATNKVFAPFIFSSDKAMDYSYNEGTGTYVDRVADEGRKTLAAISARQQLNTVTGDYTHSYVFCASSAEFFSNEILGEPSYANYGVVSAMIQSIARLETYATMELGGLSFNNYTGFGGKVLVDMQMYDKDTEIYTWHEDGTSEICKVNYALQPAHVVVYTVIVALIPLAICIVGLVVCAKRKYL